MNCANANASGSENDFAPAYVSEHGLVEAPFSIISLKSKTGGINTFKFNFGYKKVT